MANLTIVIDDRVLQAARVKAAQQGTSVNEICREAIARFAQADQEATERAERVLSIAARALPAREKAWSGRERLYEEALQSRGLAGRSRSEPGKRPAR